MSIKNNRIHLSPPHMGGYEQQYIDSAFAYNEVAPHGSNVKAFEKEVAEYVGARGAVALSSGTAAIHLALRLLGVERGDVVFCSSFTFVASANPIMYLGAEPVFIDSEPHTWNMCHIALWKALIDAEKARKLPKAVITVNVYGQSADWDALKEVCRHYDVPVIENAAQSLGATYRGRASGTSGLLGIYSFNSDKIITTSGGGMLVSDELDALEHARYLSAHAHDKHAHNRHSRIGYNYRLSNVLAGIGRGQLRVLDERIEARRRVFARYEEALGDIDGVTFMPEAGYGRSTRWLTALTIDRRRCGVTPSDVVKALAEHNIEAQRVWKPLHMQPIYDYCRYYRYDGQSEDISEQLYRQGVCLPSGSNLSEAEQDRVIDIVRRCLKGA